ncbi:DUF5685 domain-containing protein [Hathewaya histolytica]|uniref:Uncharacterized protein n=1 Tax=Hathewaya histolytica TaxID=1498 RepID=A0A4U9R4J4_HATHI|nr:DUF5685 family protein [Hathewaya histolytica]VTQ84943.1 Uncharacterised protein [Hathewaya histolytica]
MFGYVTPCKMELKIKDYEKFKAYYCGLCRTIKKDYGNLPRMVLNYDMTFLAILLDSLCEEPRKLEKIHCVVHPTEKKIIIVDNKALHYAAYCNIILVYYKLLDDVEDDKSVKASMLSKFLNMYIKNKESNIEMKDINNYIKESLHTLSAMEKDTEKDITIDKISHPFADLTGFLISNYIKDKDLRESLYFLGYNIGKWIYLIDAYDDLQKDMKDNKFNPINRILNIERLPYEDFSSNIESRMDFILTTSALNAFNILNKLPTKKNKELLHNILQLGLMEKMDKVFKRSEYNEGSI